MTAQLSARNHKRLIADTATAIEAILKAPELKELTETELQYITKAVIVDELKTKLKKEVSKHKINREIENLKRDWLNRFDSQHTRRSFETNLNYFLDWLPSDKSLSDVNARVVDAYVSYLQNSTLGRTKRKLSKNTQIQRIAACSSFWSALMRWQILDSNPWFGCRKPKKEISIKQGESVPTDADLDNLQRIAKDASKAKVKGHRLNTARKNSAGRMAYAAISVLRETGLRVGALQTIRIDKKGYFTAKTKGRTAYGKLSEKVLASLQELGLNISTPFQNYNPSTFRVWLWRASRGKFSVHSIRHHAATRYYSNTRDIAGLQRLLGHKSLLATQAYLASLGHN